MPTEGDFSLPLDIQDALELSRHIGYRESEANALGSIGLIFQARGELAQAMTYFQDALVIFKDIGFPDKIIKENCLKLLEGAPSYP